MKPALLPAAAVLLSVCASSAVLAQAGKDWPVYGGDQANTRYSVLSQINTTTVSRLRIAWLHSLGTVDSQESTPILAGETLYVTSSSGPRYVFALDPRNGSVKWQYAPELPRDYADNACCGVPHRGVTVANGRVFVARMDARLVALDAAKGEELWTTTVADYRKGYTMTSPPLAIGNLVITGYAGNDRGLRGALQAYRQETGERIWKTWTVPGPGETSRDTWQDDAWKQGGAATWHVGTYDERLKLVYWSTGNASARAAQGRSGQFPSLYSSSQLALNPENGAIVWHYQTTPSNVWGYDGVGEALLADLPVGGQGRKIPVLLKADPNGFFYVLGRNDGKLVSAAPFVAVNWASGIDQGTGRPVENADKRPGPGSAVKNVCPSAIGARNWQPVSFNPGTGLAYIPAFNLCMDINATTGNRQPGKASLAADSDLAVPGAGDHLGEMIAWDPVAQKRAWSIPEQLPFVGGALSTAGGLVFYGNANGILKAVDAKKGQELWRFPLGTGISQAPITYMVDGKQYLVVVAGRIRGPTAFLGEIGQRVLDATPEGGVVAAFELVQ